MKLRSKKEVLGEFLGHIAVGFIVCVIIAAAAFGLAWVVHLIEGVVWAKHLVEPLVFIELVLLWADVALLAWWVLVSTIRAAKELF